MAALLAPPSRLRDLWLIIREGRALTIEQLAERMGVHGHRIGPLLAVLVQSGAAIAIERGTTRWYLPARLHTCVPPEYRIIRGR